MRFVSTRGKASAASLGTALFDGLAPDGGLYVPDTIEAWSRRRDRRPPVAVRCPNSGVRVAQAVRRRRDRRARRCRPSCTKRSIFRFRWSRSSPASSRSNCFTGPTLAFKDVGARVMARLMAALGGDVTVLTATSGDTGSAVANAFHGIASARVVILYPEGRVSPTQEAQLTMFNGDSRVERPRLRRGRQLRRLPAAGEGSVRRQEPAPPDSADVGQLDQRRPAAAADDLLLPGRRRAAPDQSGGDRSPMVCTPSGNFGNLTAGLMAKRAGAPIERFVAATNVERRRAGSISRPASSGRARRSARSPTRWTSATPATSSACSGCTAAGSRRARHDIERLPLRGRRGAGDDPAGVRAHRLHPRSALRDWLPRDHERRRIGRAGRDGRGIFLATAHPAKFPEVVEPVIGRSIEKPAAAGAGARAAARRSCASTRRSRP